MPYPGTIIFHLLQGILAFLSVLYLFSRKESFYISPFRKYFTWFLLFVFYNAALIVAAIFHNDIPLLAGIGYQIGLVILAFATWQAYAAALELLLLAQRTKKFLSLLYILGALTAVGLHAIFFEVPQALNANWILWYPNQIIAIPYILFMFFAGWTFSFALARAFFSTPDTLLRVRTLFMSLSGFILPFAALFYFAAATLTHVHTAFIIVSVGLIFFLFGNIGVGFIKKNTGH